MALNFDLMVAADQKAVVQVVTKFDSCIDMTIDEYDEYIKSGADPSLLKLKKGKSIDDCTVFVLKKNLDWASHERLMRKQFEIDPVTKLPRPNPSFVMVDIQQALLDIKQPESAEYKFKYTEDKPGFASRSIVEALHNTGLLMDLYNARTAAASGSAKSALHEKKDY